MANLVARVKNLLLSPHAEWDVIGLEAADPRKLIVGYVIPLAALPAVATVFGLSVLGVEVEGETIRAPWIWMLASAALFFVLSVVGVLVFALLINALASTFSAERNYVQALKVSGYSITSAMVAGIATAVPALGIVALIGASYSLYLLFLGVPKLMKPAPDSATNYSIVATLCALGLAGCRTGGDGDDRPIRACAVPAACEHPGHGRPARRRNHARAGQPCAGFLACRRPTGGLPTRAGFN